jgi:2-polyprenyl-3-methyl-5-hydroxy-6-metoxy-1,4-benzoquinol methylase
VLEHVSNPIEQLEKAISLLNPRGVIVFEAPSSDSLLMQYVKKRNVAPYRYIESARHITFFSRKSIDLMCENNDLDLEYIESNGLDIQTVLLYEFDKEIIEKIKDIQQLIDQNLLSDHYRVFLRKR